ncbi:hypothetical protein [Staphylococcus phage LY01]|nr:hypothetical protein [Staphylococcus phage LY01]
MLNFNEDNNFIIINEKAFVPGKGKGPFVKPFRASGSQIRLFKRLGLQVTIVDEDYVYPSDKSDKKEDKNETVSESSDTQPQEESNNEEKKLDEETESKETESKETESKETESKETESKEPESKETEELKEEDKEAKVYGEIKVTEEELNEFTVAELKEELDSKGIDYVKNARKQDLINLLLKK